MLALAQLSLLGTYTRDFDTNVEPMDIDPSGREFRRRRKPRPATLPTGETIENDELLENEPHGFESNLPNREQL